MIEGSLVTAGIMLSYWIDLGLSFAPGSVAWRFTLAFQIVFCIFILIFIPFMPESPRWLVFRGRNAEAKEVLAALNDVDLQDPIVEIEFQSIHETVVEMSKGSFKDLFTMDKDRNFNRTLLAYVNQVFQQISGINLITYYAAVIYSGLGMSDFMARLLAALNGTEYFIASWPAIWLVERIGRRKLMLFGAIGQAATMAILAGVNSRPDDKPYQIAGIVFLFVFNTVFAIGWLGMSWLYPAEIVPLRIRAPANALSTSANWIFNFMVVMITPIAFNNIKYQTYIIFAVDPEKASTARVLEDVELAIPSAMVENTGTSYTITVPANTDADTLAAAVLKFTVSKYADVVTADGSVWPEDGKACGMTLDTPVTFTVRSEKCRIGKDDTAKADYTITVIRAKSTQCAIGSAKLGNVDGVVDQTGKTLTFTVPADTEDSAVTNMPLTFACSQYASIKLKDAEADWVNDTACGMKLNEEKTFVVTAEDGTTTAVYTVVIHRAPSDKKALTGATLGDIAAVINEDSHAVTFTVPADTTDSKLGEMILKFTCSPRATVKLKDAEDNWPAAGLRSGLKLGIPATFVVTAENGDTQEYTVTVNREKSTEKAITEAVLTKTGGTSVKADISEQNKTVTFMLPVGTTDADVAAMTLKFTCSQYASIKLENAGDNWPAGGQLCGMKLNETKTFVVTAENGDTQAYTVLIVRGKSSAKEITNALLLAKAGDTTSPATVKIDNAKKTIDFTLPAGTATSKLGEMILKLTVSDYATVAKKDDPGKNWTEGAVCGMELDKAATFTVTAENGSAQDYTVTITRTKSTTKDITAVKLLNADKSVIAEGKLDGTTWTITLPSDTDKALINKIGSATDIYMQVLHTGVSVKQEEGWNDADGVPYWNSGDAMCGISVNTSKTFTVTAEDGSTKTYTVAIEYTAPNAPTLSNGSAARSSKTAATVKFTTNEAGPYYYKVVTHGATAPTADEIMKSTTKGTASAGETTFTLSNLTEDARDIYIVVVSASGGESTALKIEIPAYGGGTETPDTGKFTITANAPKGGTIITNRTKADKGDEIIVTVTPDSGYQMVEGSLSYSLAVAGGETVTITGNRFTMPGGNVTITCKWETATTTAKGITSFSINGVAGAVNNTTNTITITMPRGTDVTKLTPTISTNGVKSLTPGSGETVNFTNSVTYTATMEDGSTKTYTVTVYVDKGTLADQFWDKLTDFVNQVPWWEYAKHQQSTSSYPKYW